MREQIKQTLPTITVVATLILFGLFITNYGSKAQAYSTTQSGQICTKPSMPLGCFQCFYEGLRYFCTFPSGYQFCTNVQPGIIGVTCNLCVLTATK